MIPHSRSLFLALLALGTVALGGCSLHQRLATQAVNFNLAVEKAQNEMLLLNVIRAQDRLPMYLTGMSTLTGNVQTTLSATAGGTYARAKGSTVSTASTAGNMVTDTLTHTYMPSAMASESENPTYTLSVLDTQEFMRGFMSPLGKEIFAHYWNQGWPPEVLLYLLVERVEIEKAGNTVVLRNYPDSADQGLKELTAFGKWIEEFVAKNPKLAQTSVPENIGPRLSVDDLKDLDKLVKMSKEELALTQCKAVYQLQRIRMVVQFTLPKQNARTDPCKDPTASSTYDNQLAEGKERMGVRMDDSNITFVLRSPEALLYYLGELTRVANRKNSPTVPEVCIQKRFQPLFVAFPGGECPNALLSVASTQGIYSVPAPNLDNSPEGCNPGALRLRAPGDRPSREWPVCNAGRSMQAFRLLNQVMSLQKSAKDFPSPALVRVIGQ
jgi:hypothetical protein